MLVVAYKIRIDHALVHRRLAESRSRAADMIAQGHVTVNGQMVRKSSQKISDFDSIATTGAEHSWVSRGGMKLDHAIRHWDLNVMDKVALDVGASTGGFTDVLLFRGASKVYALDVGREQLHQKLCDDARVQNIEGTNARDYEAPEDVQIIVSDVSFISQKLALGHILKTIASRGQQAQLITLIKPQFEVGKDALPKDGVVKEPAHQQAVCDDIIAWVKAQGWQFKGITSSPILGPKGNKEFLLWASLG